MWPVLLTLGKFHITVWLVFFIPTVIWASFVLWQKMRNDFTNDEIFSFSLWLLAAAGLGAMGGKVVGVTVVLATGWWWCWKKKWDFWELFDILVIVGLWLWLLGSLAWGPEAVWEVLSAIVGIVLPGGEKRYRKFLVPFGKMGFGGMVGLLCYCLSQILVAIFTSAKVYWWGLTVDQLVAAWVVAFTLVAVYLRSGFKHE
jgi:hypothetical protein